MGMDLRTYVGPYVSCKLRLGTRETQQLECTNARCPRYKRDSDHKFCPSCGQPITAVAKTETFMPSIYTVLGKHDNDLRDVSQEGRNIVSRQIYLAPNHAIPNRPVDFKLNEEGGHLDLLNFNMKSEIDWFESKYTKALEVLRRECDDVHVSWGLHQYWS